MWGTSIAQTCVDLRSDTVTLPSDDMRRVIAHAEVGEDFYGDDPSVMPLQEHAAEVMGKEAALFVPSGTMGNLLAHLTHCPSGAQVVGPTGAHTFRAETGGFARIAGMTSATVPQSEGRLDMAALRQQGVLVHPSGGPIRSVTHYGVERTDVERVIDIVSDLVRQSHARVAVTRTAT